MGYIEGERRPLRQLERPDYDHCLYHPVDYFSQVHVGLSVEGYYTRPDVKKRESQCQIRLCILLRFEWKLGSAKPPV